jgi:hypothetical protein
VAVPMLTMVAVLIPASRVGLASGSTTRNRTCRPFNPNARAFSRWIGFMARMPVKVFSTTGNKLYKHSAAKAGFVPTPKTGMRKHNSASEGTV